MDWGRVGQMNVALALWGALAAADIPVWDAHLDELLALFCAEYAGAGGPVVAPGTLKLHLGLFVVLLGLGWLMDAPPLILREIPDLAEATGPQDPRFEANETARTQLHMASLFLHLWRTHDFGAVVRKATGAA
jgi:hypothetical protein